MDDNECDDTYRQLVGMMANLHMEWVVKDVEECIARDEMHSFDGVSNQDADQLTLFNEFIRMKEYFVPEKTSFAQRRLIMLIDNIYHAVVCPVECEHFLVPYLNSKEIKEIIFLSPDGDGRRLSLDK